MFEKSSILNNGIILFLNFYIFQHITISIYQIRTYKKNVNLNVYINLYYKLGTMPFSPDNSSPDTSPLKFHTQKANC